MAEMEPVTEEMLEESNKPSAYISARHRQDATDKAQGSSGNYMLSGICAILAFVIFVVLLVLLYGDYAALSVA